MKNLKFHGRRSAAITLAVMASALSTYTQAGIIEVEQRRGFEFEQQPGASLNAQATGGQRFVFEIDAGGRFDSVLFDQADAGAGTLVGVELAVESTTLAHISASVTHGPSNLETTYRAIMNGFFAVDSSVGTFDLEQVFDLEFDCVLNTPTDTCNNGMGVPNPFNDSDTASPAQLASFLGAGTFGVDLLVDGPTLRVEIEGDGRGEATSPNSWIGELVLTYVYEVDMPNPVPVPGTLLLMMVGMLGVRVSRRRRL